MLGSHAHTDGDGLPVASRGDDMPRAALEVRAAYRFALVLLASLLISLLAGRGYGLEGPGFAGATPSRRSSGEWVSGPWAFSGARTPLDLHLTVDASACARVVRVEVTETASAVHITVWRRHVHPRCAPLSIAVKLKAPLAARAVVDGGDLAAGS